MFNSKNLTVNFFTILCLSILVSFVGCTTVEKNNPASSQADYDSLYYGLGEPSPYAEESEEIVDEIELGIGKIYFHGKGHVLNPETFKFAYLKIDILAENEKGFVGIFSLSGIDFEIVNSSTHRGWGNSSGDAGLNIKFDTEYNGQIVGHFDGQLMKFGKNFRKLAGTYQGNVEGSVLWNVEVDNH